VAYVAAIAAIAGAAVQAYGSIQQGKAKKAAMQFNTRVNQQNAEMARADAALEAKQQDRINRQRLGSIIAANAASGFSMDGGSVFDVLADAAAQGELQKQSILYQGEQRARGYLNTAKLDEMSGEAAVRSSYTGAASSLLSGAGNTYGALSRTA